MELKYCRDMGNVRREYIGRRIWQRLHIIHHIQNGINNGAACITAHSCQEMPCSQREYKGRRLSQMQQIWAKMESVSNKEKILRG
jgi:hypothetical protein